MCWTFTIYDLRVTTRNVRRSSWKDQTISLFSSIILSILTLSFLPPI